MNVQVQTPTPLRITLNASILTKVQENLYELAKKDGFSGSLTDFLNSLKPQAENGTTFTPHIENGILSWTNDGNLPNPEPFTLDDPELDEIVNHILNHG